MFFVKYLLMLGGAGMILVATGILGYDLYLEMHYRRALAAAGSAPLPTAPQVRWRTSLALALLAWAPLLLALSVVVIPIGMAGVRARQAQCAHSGPLHPE